LQIRGGLRYNESSCTARNVFRLVLFVRLRKNFVKVGTNFSISGQSLDCSRLPPEMYLLKDVDNEIITNPELNGRMPEQVALEDI
jgi:hypothetical protein